MTVSRHDRQSFLGPNSQALIERAVVGVVGAGGGGTHVIQQLAHVGFMRYVIYDFDAVEESNLNRMVGATAADANARAPKLDVARRVISGLSPKAEILGVDRRWQDEPEPLRVCDLIFGCVDGFNERRELEACARRHLIPLIDVGMDVHVVGDEPPRMGGQVILSMPGGPCMHCLNFLNTRVLAAEGERYGDAGGRPQVVWPNGVLASTAVGLGVDLLTGWTRARQPAAYLVYDGNSGTLTPHPRLLYFGGEDCPHYPPGEVGTTNL
ncbi:MAG: ThiF family adenylyltransferase [Acidobacteria bacterium]|nr:ThiF family adenylyltransferase [Acidobacteriota bacterium]